MASGPHRARRIESIEDFQESNHWAIESCDNWKNLAVVFPMCRWLNDPRAPFFSQKPKLRDIRLIQLIGGTE
jgi:hypothetical protein